MKEYYNTHVHIFNAECVPWGFYGKTNRGIAKILTLFSGVFKVWIKFLMRYRPFGILDKGSLLARMLDEVTQDSQEAVLRVLMDKYRNFPQMKFAVLPIDFDFMQADEPLLNYRSQLKELINLKFKYPDILRPFVCADPRRAQGKELVEFVDYYISEKGFAGIKLYPALGFYPFDPGLYELYAYAERNSIPIITHCDRGGIFYQGKTSEQHLNPLHLPDVEMTVKYGKGKVPGGLEKMLSGGREQEYLWKPMKEFKNNFLNPFAYREVLHNFPNLKLCFAHFGGVEEILKAGKKNSAEKTETVLRQLSLASVLDKDKFTFSLVYQTQESSSWFNQILELMNYPNVYADISYTLHSDSAMKQILMSLENERVRSRVIFGTDYFLVQREKDEVALVRDAIAALNRSGNYFDRIASENPKNLLATVSPIVRDFTPPQS